MAHFAKITNGYVAQVIAVDNSMVPTEDEGQQYLASIGLQGEWIQTSYTASRIEGQDRGPYAGIGYSWDGSVFTAPIIEETP